jgi:hypothetical protein
MDSSFKEYLSGMASTLALNSSISSSEAEKKASMYLLVLAKIADTRHILAEEKIKATSIQTVTFAEVLSEQKAKTVTENKMNAEANPFYIKTRESVEELENDIVYLKAYFDVFTNAHLFYRAVMKGEHY